MSASRLIRSPTRAALLLAAGLLTFAGIAATVLYHMNQLEQNVGALSDLHDPSPYRVALLGNLDKIHLSALNYMNTTDEALPEQIAKSESEFENSLLEFQKQNPR